MKLLNWLRDRAKAGGVPSTRVVRHGVELRAGNPLPGQARHAFRWGVEETILQQRWAGLLRSGPHCGVGFEFGEGAPACTKNGVRPAIAVGFTSGAQPRPQGFVDSKVVTPSRLDTL